MEKNLGVGDAIALSIRAAIGNVGGLIVLIILECLVVILGILAICLGVFVAIPVIYAANAFAYRQVFPYLGLNFESGPPPPQAYGGGYGTNYGSSLNSMNNASACGL